jgi:E3 ubiquitin-protein ligase DOA10
METPSGESFRTPGIVLFAAILNFISAAFMFLLSAVAAAILIFGNAVGFYDFAVRQVNQLQQGVSATLGLNLIFGILLGLGAAFTGFYIFVGTALLKGKRIVWYLQVVLSLFGLLGYPLGTVLNLIILIFFFQRSVRTFFKV